MAVITLTSDWNNDDYYISAMKGAMLASLPQALVIDISHRVSRFSSSLAAFIVKSAYKRFPVGSVHIIAMEQNKTYGISIVMFLVFGCINT